MIWIDLSESRRGELRKQQPLEALQQLISWQKKYAPTNRRVQLRSELAALQKKEEAQILQKKQQPTTASKCPANESVVNLTEQSSDSALTNEADESEQITCSETFEQVFQ